VGFAQQAVGKLSVSALGIQRLDPGLIIRARRFSTLKPTGVEIILISSRAFDI
jgi:hypothetical protein